MPSAIARADRPQTRSSDLEFLSKDTPKEVYIAGKWYPATIVGVSDSTVFYILEETVEWIIHKPVSMLGLPLGKPETRVFPKGEVLGIDIKRVRVRPASD